MNSVNIIVTLAISLRLSHFFLLSIHVLTSIPSATALSFSPDRKSSLIGKILDESGGLVQVHVEQTFPGITPKEAKDAWMSYQWKKGGGLLGVIVTSSDETTKAWRKRRLFPILMEETLNNLESIPSSNDGIVEIEQQMINYSVTNMGLLSSEIQEGTHTATVNFVHNTLEKASSTTMIWDVSFQAINRRELWQSFTESNLQTVALNLESYLATPLCYKRITNLSFDQEAAVNVKNVTDEWVDFIWEKGGGLPIPDFMLISLKDGKRMYIPPFLLECLESVKSNPTDNCEGEIRYYVDNPELLFLHTHAGRVIFNTSSDIDTGKHQIQMVWEVEIRPFRGFDTFVTILISSIISNLARNFKNHLKEPGAMISVYPPRGGDGKTPLGKIPKNTWLGGVFTSHLSDERSTLEQTVSMFQPWTWGRSSGYDKDGEGEEISRGFLLK